MGKKALLKIIFSVASEILLNLTGMDDLADYSEFLAHTHALAHPPQVQLYTTL